MPVNPFFRLLEIPAVYRLSQFLLAPGAQSTLMRKIENILQSAPPAQSTLDVACGPRSWLWEAGVKPVGLDFSMEYIADFSKNQNTGVVGSAFELPFRAESFDAAWSIGLLHHLAEPEARETIAEMQRILRPGGRLVIFDGVYPRRAFTRPVAWILRKNDRGKYMRCQEELEALLPDRDLWQVERVSYSYFGHEGIFCIYRKHV